MSSVINRATTVSEEHSQSQILENAPLVGRTVTQLHV